MPSRARARWGWRPPRAERRVCCWWNRTRGWPPPCASVTYELDTMNVVVVRIPDSKPIADAIAYFEKQKNVLAVNRDQINELQ